jgi:hypothetical protein
MIDDQHKFRTNSAKESDIDPLGCGEAPQSASRRAFVD